MLCWGAREDSSFRGCMLGFMRHGLVRSKRMRIPQLCEHRAECRLSKRPFKQMRKCEAEAQKHDAS